MIKYEKNEERKTLYNKNRIYLRITIFPPKKEEKNEKM